MSCASVSSQRRASMLRREATYLMKSFFNGWVQLEELHRSCWRTLRSWSCSSRLWRRTCMSWRTTGQLTALSTTLSFLKPNLGDLHWNFWTSAAGATNQRAHSCLAQSHVSMERKMFLTIYRVSAWLTIYSLLFLACGNDSIEFDWNNQPFHKGVLRYWKCLLSTFELHVGLHTFSWCSVCQCSYIFFFMIYQQPGKAWLQETLT